MARRYFIEHTNQSDFIDYTELAIDQTLRLLLLTKSSAVRLLIYVPFFKLVLRLEGRKETFYLTTLSTHFSGVAMCQKVCGGGGGHTDT